MAASDAKKEMCTLCDRIGLKPFTKQNIFYHYIPLHGVVSYGVLSINVMNPSMVSKLVPKKDMTNLLLLSSITGLAFYLYGRPHLSTVPRSRRGLYAILGGTLFSLGSVLVWAIVKSSIPKSNAALSTLAGLASGALMVQLALDYCAETDKLARNN